MSPLPRFAWRSAHICNGLAAVWLFLAICVEAAPIYEPVRVTPPPPRREFRAAWVATVENIDWPSQPGLSTAQQKAELIQILDRAVALHLNAIILQVRPACDALYASKIEPWSIYLTGTMGRAPSPYYDPLAFAVAEAHRRGLELHAWLNPFRASHPSNKGPLPEDHISRKRPDLVRQYGQYMWLDPGEPDARAYSLRVVMDIVKRYDIDGLHFDDYFYPYKIKDGQGREIPFPDEASWRKTGAVGKLSREDWRRENVNRFIAEVYHTIKAEKPWVKFGISPFGIWQAGHPATVKGKSGYDELYCDARKWMAEGWLDYCAPQLYWSIKSPEQSFPALLQWWEEQNTRQRQVWAGLATMNVGGRWPAGEIIEQIKDTRKVTANPGTIQYSMKWLLHDRAGLDAALEREVFAEPALVPACPWLEDKGPSTPTLKLEGGKRAVWSPGGANAVALWVWQTKTEGRWQTALLPGESRGEKLSATPEAVALTAIDRCGLASEPVVLQRATPKVAGDRAVLDTN